MTKRIRAVAFDLGGTLVEYYRMAEFPAILTEAIASAHAALPGGHAKTTLAEARLAADLEASERADFQVTPLHQRLTRIFSVHEEIAAQECTQAFLEPIFGRACVYEDTLEALTQLRTHGYKLAIVSNTPWGSPADLWREELERLQLASMVDASFFCTDVGWRKPAGPIFEATVEALKVDPAECLFVGDDRRWDIEGAQSAGMTPVLIDRTSRHANHAGYRIQSLSELFPLLDRLL